MNPKANHGLFGAISAALKPINEEKSSLRLVKTHEHPSGAKAKVYKDGDWNEYRVKYYDKNGKHEGEDKDSHTDDLEDAHGTAQAELKRMHESNDGSFEAMHAHVTHLADIYAAHSGVMQGHAALYDLHSKTTPVGGYVSHAPHFVEASKHHTKADADFQAAHAELTKAHGDLARPIEDYYAGARERYRAPST